MAFNCLLLRITFNQIDPRRPEKTTSKHCLQVVTAPPSSPECTEPLQTLGIGISHAFAELLANDDEDTA